MSTPLIFLYLVYQCEQFTIKLSQFTSSTLSIKSHHPPSIQSSSPLASTHLHSLHEQCSKCVHPHILHFVNASNIPSSPLTQLHPRHPTPLSPHPSSPSPPSILLLFNHLNHSFCHHPSHLH